MDTFTAISIDDHSLFRTGIELIIRGSLPKVEFASFASLGQALEVHKTAPDIVLLDLHLDGIGGHEAIPLLKLRWPASAIIVVTSEKNQAEIERARASGGDAVVLKSEPPEHFIRAIRALLPAVESVGEIGPAPAVSHRQLEVLRLLREGLSNKAIARRMGISEFTVRARSAAPKAV